MADIPITRRTILSAAGTAAVGGLAGCSSADDAGGSGAAGGGATSTPEPTRGEIIEEFDQQFTVGTYEQPDEQGSIADYQYRGRGSFPVYMTHTAHVEYEIDLTVQEGYETIPLNVYFVDADNYLKLQQNESFDAIDEGTIEPVEETDSVTFTTPPGLYYMVFGSAEVGRESTFNIDYTSRQYLNAGAACIESPIHVGHLSLGAAGSLFNVESWNLRHHIQYAGDADTTYQLELTLVSADSEETITQTQRQFEGCETNFVYADEETLNVVAADERIMANIAILDESGEETLAEQTQEIATVLR
ncbi:hypothetical protein [Haloplanus sp. C73]|uniref:hypothetical protein n=1 Tax=Haloplanus sp. C73 TaxID=3421641 RepID=UPI003EBBB7FB